MKKDIRIQSKIENLIKVEKLVDEISTACNLSAEIYGNVLIATLEAANNAITHGNKQDEEKGVDIKFSWDTKELQLVVTDQGPGFDYRTVPDPTSPENVEKVSGRGVFLMEKLSDAIKFTENGRKVWLTFNL